MTGAKAQRRKNNNNWTTTTYNKNKQTKKEWLRYSEGLGTSSYIEIHAVFYLPTPYNFVKTAYRHSIRQQAFVIDISEWI